MKKRLLGLLLSVTMVAGLLAGCGTVEETEEPSEVVGAQIEVDKEDLNDVKVEGSFEGAELTVFILRLTKSLRTR